MNHALVLYKFDACPFCYRVQSWLEGRDVPVVYKDTRQDPEAREELQARTGRTQVPCLFIDGEPLFESGDILEWLEEHYGDPPPQRSLFEAPPKQDGPTRKRDRLLERLRRG